MPQLRQLTRTATSTRCPPQGRKRMSRKTQPTSKTTLAAFTFRTCVYFWTRRFQIWGGTRPVASAAGVDCLTQRRRERRGGELRQASPFPPAGCGRGIVAAWSSGRRFPSRFRPRGGNAASGTRRPRRAAPTQGQGRGSPRRASWPTSPERACGSRPRGARGRPCRTPATACRRSA